MDFTSGLLGGGISILGGFLQNEWAKDRQEDANAFNAQQAGINRDFQAEQSQKQMDFQERMSSTAYQRTMADMRAGGLNPILAYQRGGASSPPGAAASGSQSAGAQAAPVQNILGPAASSALSFMQMSETIQNLQAQNKNIKADTQLKLSEVDRIGSQIPNINQTTKNLMEENVRLRAEAAKADIERQTRESAPGKAAVVGGTLAGDSGVGKGIENVIQMYKGFRSPTINQRFPSKITND